MPDTMRAIVKARPEEGLELREVGLPRVSPDDVLLKVRATSICGTDVHIYRWDGWSQRRIGPGRLPQIAGHEVTGEVVEVGSQVRRVKRGDLVSAETHIPCRACTQCLNGQQHICANLTILGVDRDGAFADYLAIPESVCWVNDPSIPPEFASVQEPLGNAVYAVLGEDRDVAGRSVAIVGDGPIGLLAVAVAHAAGACPIFLVGMWDYNMEIGRRLGADHLLFADRPDPDRVQYVRDHTYGVGADIVVEMAGVSDAIVEGFKLLRKGGRFTAFGVTGGGTVPLDYNDSLVFKGAQVHGVNGRLMFDTWLRVRNLLATGRLNIGPVITHLFPLEEYDRGFQEMMKLPRVSAKVVLFPDPAELAAARRRLASRSAAAPAAAGAR